MRKLLLLLICTGSLQALAQNPTRESPALFPQEKWQVGFSPFALVSNILKFEVHRKIQDGHYLGLQGGPLVGEANISHNTGNPIYKPVRGSSVKAVHKIYFPEDKEYTAFYLVHGPFYHDARTKYPAMVWQPYEEEGVEYMRQVETDLDYSSFRMGYDVSLGVEFRFDFFYMALSMGMGYVSKLSEQEPPREYDFDNMAFGIDYRGIKVLAAAKLGYLIK